MVGAVFNREYPGNRGRPATSSVESRPFPRAINFYLNELESYVEHQEEVKQKISIFFRQHSTGPIRAGSLKIQL